MGFFTGIQLYGKAFGILFSRKFWWFLLFPVIILLLLFIGGNILISLAGDSLYGLIEAKLTAWVGGISCWLRLYCGFCISSFSLLSADILCLSLCRRYIPGCPNGRKLILPGGNFPLVSSSLPGRFFGESWSPWEIWFFSYLFLLYYFFAHLFRSWG